MIYPEINYLVPSHVTKYVFMWIERKGKREVTPKPGDMYLTFPGFAVFHFLGFEDIRFNK
jgi:hypothetical protein